MVYAGGTMKQNIPVTGPESEHAFGPVIYSYTRKQALEDGAQVDVSETARAAGFKTPVYLTREVWSTYVEVPPGVQCQDEKGRLWDIVWMLRFGIRKATQGESSLRFKLYVRNDNRAARLITLKAECGPVDMEDPRPAITVMMPDED